MAPLLTFTTIPKEMYIKKYKAIQKLFYSLNMHTLLSSYFNGHRFLETTFHQSPVKCKKLKGINEHCNWKIYTTCLRIVEFINFLVLHKLYPQYASILCNLRK